MQEQEAINAAWEAYVINVPARVGPTCASCREAVAHDEELCEPCYLWEVELRLMEEGF